MENIQKTPIVIEITPKKRVLRSIARDLTLNMSILELIDNSIDAWKRNKTGDKLVVSIKISKGVKEDKKISQLDYEDNSGGISISKISELFTLGDSGGSENEESIGEFGVGLKRSLFSISDEFLIESKANEEEGFTCKVNVKSFINDPNWKLEYLPGTNISKGKTIVKFLGLNFEVGDKIERELRKEIAETYSHTISNNGEVFVNNQDITFHKFDEWTEFRGDYEDYSPKNLQGKIEIEEKKVEVNIIVGLMKSLHTTGDYGFYIYCNDRLAVKGGKDEGLGFNGEEFSYPHNRLARFRCEVRLNGSRGLMPWNSTKSGINYNLPLMLAILPGLKKLSKPYLNFSNRIASPTHSGLNGLVETTITDVKPVIKNDLAKFFETLPNLNSRKKMIKTKMPKLAKVDPWKKSLMDTITITESIIKKKSPEHKNRVAVLILDSTVEVSMRSFLKNVIGTKESRKEGDERGFPVLMNHAKQRSGNLNISSVTWTNIRHLHDIRDKLYHEFSDIIVTDQSIEDYKESVIDILEKLLSINF